MEQIAHGQPPPRLPLDTDEPRFRCRFCCDLGYVETKPAMVRSQHSGKLVPAGGATVSWFCSCEIGKRAEAGYWFDVVYPTRDGRRIESHQGKARLYEYLSARPAEKLWLGHAVEGLRQQHESARKRKLEAMEKS